MTRWQDNANCKNVPVAIFFPERGDSKSVRIARKLCAECPVRQECLDENLDEVDGIWGGTTPKERQAMRGGGDDVDRTIVRMARAGMDDMSIAEALGMNVKTVARRRLNAGIRKTRGWNRISEDDAA